MFSFPLVWKKRHDVEAIVLHADDKINIASESNEWNTSCSYLTNIIKYALNNPVYLRSILSLVSHVVILTHAAINTSAQMLWFMPADGNDCMTSRSIHKGFMNHIGSILVCPSHDHAFGPKQTISGFMKDHVTGVMMLKIQLSNHRNKLHFKIYSIWKQARWAEETSLKTWKVLLLKNPHKSRSACVMKRGIKTKREGGRREIERGKERGHTFNNGDSANRTFLGDICEESKRINIRVSLFRDISCCVQCLHHRNHRPNGDGITFLLFL